MASTPNFLWDHLPESRQEVGQFWLPKFKISFSNQMIDVLKAMGIKAAFDEEKADLSDMLVELDKDNLPEMKDGVPLYVDSVMHKAVIEVNEEGTKAVACTAVRGRTTKQSARRFMEFVADHPFVFFVVEEVSRAVVFVGHILDPTESEQTTT
ncbi:hypothetical protein PR202_gb00802 [Eleusine coracana subsp. coracana]|uniref:Serpin domain-containing protein n=1 Tax=Eleusine coracana subsp. coracana TaxID=191504 RepID=A0AAV5DU98_ELECO|nr:hypothetical protein PR202_gb00802 [Eleusine coracana subsp. coracana]